MKQSFLARRRVALGFVFGAFVLYLAQPTVSSLLAGAAVALVGQAVRLWAAGHLEKSREVTVSGPYQFTRHPLYVGSSIMALGVAIAGRSWWVAILVAAYMGFTLTAAIRGEEAFLRERFGAAYDDYAARRGPRVERRFSWERAWRNKEYRALAGLTIFLGLLTMRMALL
jgi:protein-S-isoprenylcysteine O-methyltransferase Ste14